MALRALSAQIASLPDTWHGAGSVSNAVLDALIRHAADRRILHSLETGTGKTTLLLSHLSARHQVFTVDDSHGYNSLSKVRASPLLDSNSVEFIIGPTQLTLRGESLDGPLQLAFLDGPHGYPFPELEYHAVYPHLEPSALLVVDDIQIPTVAHLFAVLREDAMFQLLEVCGTTAFFVRTGHETFDPLGDGWWQQGFNQRRYPTTRYLRPTARVRAALKSRARRLARRAFRRPPDPGSLY